MADPVAVISLAKCAPQILSSYPLLLLILSLTNEWKPELVLDERHVERGPEYHEGDGVGVLQLGVLHDGRDHQEDGEHQHYYRHHDRDL